MRGQSLVGLSGTDGDSWTCCWGRGVGGGALSRGRTHPNSHFNRTAGCRTEVTLKAEAQKEGDPSRGRLWLSRQDARPRRGPEWWGCGRSAVARAN